MGYTMRNGRYANTEDIVVVGAGSVTANGTGSAVEVGDRRTVSLSLAVTAATGTTPTLDVTLQTSNDGTNWYTAGTFAQRTAAATERKSFAVDRFVRASYTLGGTTPNFTFSISGEAA